MHRKTFVLGCAIALLAAAAIGCNYGPDDSFTDPYDYEPVVFPWEGQLGDPDGASTWGSTAADLGSPAAFPFTALVEVEIDGVVTHQPRFLITGASGAPNPLAEEGILGQGGFQASLEPQRMIRLRAKRGEGEFEPGMGPIGALEFDFEYSTLCVDAVRAYPSTEASNALALVGPPTQTATYFEKVHVVLLDPQGFELDFPNADLAGNGPLLDLALDDHPSFNCSLAPVEFTISDVRVTDPDGATLFEVPPGPVVLDSEDDPRGDALFRIYPVDVDDV